MLAVAVWFWGCSDSSKDTKDQAFPTGPSFAKGSVGVNLDQWANGSPPPTNESWQNGNLNGNNSAYAEGRAVPFRLAVEGLPVNANTVHFITIQYDFTAGGHKAYDYLASIEATEPNALAQVCATGGGGRSTLCGASNAAMPGGVSTSQVGFPSDGFTVDNLTVSGAMTNDGAPRFLRIFGGTIQSISAVSHAGPTDGNSTGEMLVEFKATGSAVLLVWSGHLARSSYWNNNNPPDGAGEVSGSPWHMRTNNLDGAGAANQDRSIQPSAIVENPTLTVVKTANPVGPVSAGTDIGFDITVTNNGPGTANAVVLTDTLPAGFTWSETPDKTECSIATGAQTILTCNLVSLAANASFLVHVQAATQAANCGLVTNKAWAEASNAPPTSDDASVTVQCPNVSIVKTPDAQIKNAGEQISFSIVVSNAAGGGTATNVHVTDALPSGTGVNWSINPAVAECQPIGTAPNQSLDCTFASLAPGASKTITVVTNTTGASCKQYNNTASFTTGNNGSGSDVGDITVQCPSLSIVKTPDAQIKNAGEQISFSVVVSNAGPGTATNVHVTDALPSGTGVSWSINPAVAECQPIGTAPNQSLDCTFASLASGASKTITVVSNTTGASCGQYNNTASYTSGNGGSGSNNGDITVQCPNLSITKTPDGQLKNAGEQISFSVVVSNAGPGTATNVHVTDALPSGTGVSWSINPAVAECQPIGTAPNQSLDCTFASLASGASQTITVVSNTTSASCKQYNNTASYTSDNAGSGNNSGDITVQCPTLSIVKTPNNGTVNPGGTATFTIVVSNAGPGTAFNVQLADTLPPNLTWTEDVGNPPCTMAQYQGSGPNRVLNCNIGTMASGGSFTVHVSASIPSGFTTNPPSAAGTPLEIDGNLVDDAPPPAFEEGTDWNALGLNCNTLTGCKPDLPTGSGDDSFGEGTKEDDLTPTIVDGQIPNNKSDLKRFYIAKQRFGTDDHLYFAWERVQAPNGTTNMDIELNKLAPVAPANLAVRSAGDVLIKYDLAQGGTNPVLGFHRWVTTGPKSLCEAANSTPCWGVLQSLAGNPNVAAAINTVSVTDLIPPVQPNLDALTFGEARINLQGAGIFPAGQCVSFGSAYLKSRSSDSFTAAVKDFIAPLLITLSNCTPVPLPNTATVRASNFQNNAWISDGGLITVQTASASSLFAPANGQQLAWTTASGNATIGLPFVGADAAEQKDGRSSGRTTRGNRLPDTPALPSARVSSVGRISGLASRRVT